MTSRAAILTDAAGGIGQAMTAALLADDHALVLVDRDGEALHRFCHGLRSSEAADGLYPIVADFGAPDLCEEAVDRTVQMFGRVGAVKNNAGVGVSSLRPDAESRHPSAGRPRFRFVLENELSIQSGTF